MHKHDPITAMDGVWTDGMADVAGKQLECNINIIIARWRDGEKRQLARLHFAICFRIQAVTQRRYRQTERQ